MHQSLFSPRQRLHRFILLYRQDLTPLFRLSASPDDPYSDSLDLAPLVLTISWWRKVRFRAEKCAAEVGIP